MKSCKSCEHKMCQYKQFGTNIPCENWQGWNIIEEDGFPKESGRYIVKGRTPNTPGFILQYIGSLKTFYMLDEFKNVIPIPVNFVFAWRDIPE